MIDVRLRLSEADLLDASEDLGRLLWEEGEPLAPALRDILLSVDEALTAAVAGELAPHAG